MTTQGCLRPSSTARSWNGSGPLGPPITTITRSSSERFFRPDVLGLVSGARSRTFACGAAARSQPQIQADRRGSPAEAGIQSPDLIGRWNPESAGSRILVDSSGQHHDGLLVGNVSAVSTSPLRGQADDSHPSVRTQLRWLGGPCRDPRRPLAPAPELYSRGMVQFSREDRECWLLSKCVGDRQISMTLAYPGCSPGRRARGEGGSSLDLAGSQRSSGLPTALCPACGTIPVDRGPVDGQGGRTHRLPGSRRAPRITRPVSNWPSGQSRPRGGMSH